MSTSKNCREQYGIHTCDKRRPLSYLRNAFPNFDIEEGFTEEDELYESDVRESEDHIVERARSVLDHIFKNDRESGMQGAPGIGLCLTVFPNSHFDYCTQWFYKRFTKSCGSCAGRATYWRYIIIIIGKVFFAHRLSGVLPFIVKCVKCITV